MYNFSLLFFFFFFRSRRHLIVICNLGLGGGGYVETERRDAFYLSRACARWFATAILVSFDSPCGLSVWISVIEMCGVVASGCVCCVCLFNAASFIDVMHNLSSLVVFARGLTLFDIIQYHRIMSRYCANRRNQSQYDIIIII